MSTHLAALRLTPPIALHGEGPTWDPVSQRVLWLDMLAGRIVRTDLDGHSDTIDLADPVAAVVRRRRTGTHLVVGERTVWHLDLDRAGPHRAMADLPVPSGARCNEGCSGPDGTMYIGTMAYDAAPGGGTVIALSPDGTVRTSLNEVTIANGMQFIEEDRVLFIDSPTRQVRSYRVNDDHTWREPTIAADLTSQPGVPDGLCLDADEGIWIALWDGASVIRVDRTGKLTHTVTLPLRRPTACALAGPAGTTLVITTSAHERVPGTDPDAGALFIVETTIPRIDNWDPA